MTNPNQPWTDPNQPHGSQPQQPWDPPTAAQPPYQAPAPQQPMAQQPMAGQPPFPQQSYQPAPQQSWQQQPYQPQPWQPPVAQTPDGTDRTMAMFAHLSSPIAWALSAGWLNFLGPLVIWLLYKDRSPFVRNAAAGAFNFTITMWLVSIIGWIMIVTVILLPIGLLLVAIGGLGALVLGIVGAVKTSNGEVYNYPWQIRLLN